MSRVGLRMTLPCITSCYTCKHVDVGGRLQERWAAIRRAAYWHLLPPDGYVLDQDVAPINPRLAASMRNTYAAVAASPTVIEHDANPDQRHRQQGNLTCVTDLDSHKLSMHFHFAMLSSHQAIW